MSNIVDLVLACWVEDGTPFALLVVMLVVLSWVGLRWVLARTERRGSEEADQEIHDHPFNCPDCNLRLRIWRGPACWTAICPNSSACSFAAFAPTAPRLAALIRKRRKKSIASIMAKAA